jgi:DNA-binding transcriptional LysR family regulator
MELRHLRYFVAVADELHFRRAAERLHVAQPAVSEQVRKLESELGVRLLNRTQRSVSLTDAGAAFLPEARRTLRQAEAARQAARTALDGAHARVRVGYVPASLPPCLSPALQRLSETMSNLQARLEPGSGAELLRAVRAGELDAAIVSLPAPTKDLRGTPLGEQRLVAALPDRHPMTAGASLPLEALAPDAVVVLERDAGPPFHDAAIAACRAAGLSPRLVEIPNVEQLLLAVASGAGAGLVPEWPAERYLAPGIRLVRLEGEHAGVPTAVVTCTDSTHMPTAAFVRAAYDAGRTHAVVRRAVPTTAVA